MFENERNNNQESLVCHIEGLAAYRSDKTPVNEIPSNLPQWKQDLLKKKRKEKMEEHKAEMARLYEESQTPEWMKPLKKLHQRRKSEQSEKIEAERRKAEEERQRFEAMPAWKKQLIYKKKAKSAENLFSGCDSKNVEYETPGDKVERRSESIQRENIEVDSEDFNGLNDENGSGVSENKNCDEGIIYDQVENPVDANEESKQNENGELKYTENDDDPVEDLDKNDGEEIVVSVKVDEMSDDGDEEPQVSEDENDNYESDEAKESEESQILSDDENEDGRCYELDENGMGETGKMQIDGSEQENEEVNGQ